MRALTMKLLVLLERYWQDESTDTMKTNFRNGNEMPSSAHDTIFGLHA